MDLASIDVGTNAVLLLVIRRNDKGMEEVLDRSSVTRLGEGLLGTGRLSVGAMERTAMVLEEYRRVIDRHGAEIVSCFGTSALREASNRDQFIAMVKERAGIDLRVASEYEEAYYTYLSVRGDPAVRGQNLVIVDIGGGSTEIIRGSDERFAGFISLPVGTVKLTELFVKHDPPLREELDALVEFVRGKIAALETAGDGDRTIVGVAGTITTLAAMILGLKVFDKSRIHGYPVSLSALDGWIEKLEDMTIAERRTIPGMEPGREDLLLQGMVLMREIVAAYGSAQFVVSTYGARYGVVYEAVGGKGLQDPS